MKRYVVSNSDTSLLCTELELMKLESICNNFIGDNLNDIDFLSIIEFNEFKGEYITFDQLNQPENDTAELNVSYWGDEGLRLNSVADIDANRYYNCNFSILVFLDGCDTFFRSQIEIYKESTEERESDRITLLNYLQSNDSNGDYLDELGEDKESCTLDYAIEVVERWVIELEADIEAEIMSIVKKYKN